MIGRIRAASNATLCRHPDCHAEQIFAGWWTYALWLRESELLLAALRYGRSRQASSLSGSLSRGPMQHSLITFQFRNENVDPFKLMGSVTALAKPRKCAPTQSIFIGLTTCAEIRPRVVTHVTAAVA